MKISENVDLKQYSSIKIGGTAKYVCDIETENDILEFLAFAKKENLPAIIIGSGTNTFFDDGLIKKIIGLVKIKGKFKTYEGPDFVNVEVGAGEAWDELVEWSVSQKLSGLECLSLIPGTVGASPVQNIGAYGHEVKNVITHVRAYDIEHDGFVEIPNDQCLFEYRESLFKKYPTRFIISNVSMQLKKVSENLSIPQYKDLQFYFAEKKQKTTSVDEIRKAVIKIRTEKLPDLAVSPNCGSFFKNPVIPNSLAEKLSQQFSKMPQFKIDDDHVKVFAGWLIENAVLKGFEYKNLAIDENNALVIINKGESRASDLLEFEKIINEKIEQVYGIVLEREPNLVK